MPTEEINHQDRLHARYSPSSLKHRETCPGWESASGTNDAAEAGTRAHEALQAHYEGNDAPLAAMAENERWWVEQTIDFVEPLLAGHSELIAERRLFAEHPLLKEHSHGTPDLVIFYGPTRAHIVDLKTGIRRVDHPEKNLQGFAYVVALFDTYPTLNEVAFSFAAPRIVDGFQTHSFVREADYDRILARLLFTIEKCLDPEKVLNPTWGSCVYCKEKLHCDAFRTLIHETYGQKEITPETRSLTADEFRQACKEDSPENLAYLHLVADVVERWAEARKAYTLEKAQEGLEVSGFEMRFKNGRMSVTSTGDVVKALENYAVPLDDLVKASTVSLSALESVFCTGLEGREKTARKKLLIKELSTGQAIKTSEPTPYLHRL